MDKAEGVTIAHWLAVYLSGVLKVDLEQIDTAVRFDEYGLDSVKVVEMGGALSRWLGRDIEPDLFYDYPSIDDLSAYLLIEMKD